jgi:hypothetical protein
MLFAVTALLECQLELRAEILKVSVCVYSTTKSLTFAFIQLLDALPGAEEGACNGGVSQACLLAESRVLVSCELLVQPAAAAAFCWALPLLLLSHMLGAPSLRQGCVNFISTNQPTMDHVIVHLFATLLHKFELVECLGMDDISCPTSLLRSVAVDQTFQQNEDSINGKT